MLVPFAARGTDYDEEDVQAVVSLMRQSEHYNKWQPIRDFEAAWSESFGSQHSLAVSSGTAALHLALSALGIGPGDEVITTPWTWVATANVILLVGAKPVLADIEADTLNLDINSVKTKITPKTKAIIAVHFAGNPCHLQALQQLCSEHNLKLIQDAAHAPGARFNGQSIEKWGDLVCYSFYTQKNMSTLGEGGMVTCNEHALFEKLKLYQNHGVRYLNHYQNPSAMERPWLRECVEPGFNYRLSEFGAAVGLTQLKKLPLQNEKRLKLAARYIAALSDIKGIECIRQTEGASSSWHFFVIFVLPEFKLSRDQLLKALDDRGVKTSVHYTPLYHFSPFSGETLEMAEQRYEQALTLPLYPQMEFSMVDYVVEQIKELSV